MDAKVTLSFDADVIKRAKAYADKQNMSLSRLMELLLDKITSNSYLSLEDLPVSSWVNQAAEGKVEYKVKRKKRSALKNEFLSSRKKK